MYVCIYIYIYTYKLYLYTVLFCFGPSFYDTPVTNYMLLWSMLLCKKTAPSPDVINIYAP